MKSTIVDLIVVAALSFSGAVLAAGETENKAQPPAAQPVAAASAVPATATGSTPATSAKESHPAMKHSISGKHAKAKQPRSKNLDLRHCLELESNAAIAKCAGE